MINIFKYFVIINIPKKIWIKHQWKKQFNYKLNLKNPITYNEKIQWLKIYWKNNLAKKCADKITAREYIDKSISKKYLNDIIKVYNNTKEINFKDLPKSFVIKNSNGSGMNIICKDKNGLNEKEVKRKINLWKLFNYGKYYKEWVYENNKSKIIVEKYIEDKMHKSLIDYKIFCFQGKAHFIQVDFGRYENHERNYYDLNWDYIPMSIGYPTNISLRIDKPKNFEKMIELSEILSKPFPHVRVDMYNIEGNIIVGELTFFHGSGFEKFNNIKYELELGKLIDIKNIQEEK